MKTFCDGRLKVFHGDITTLEVDIVVNAANSSLLGGGGVDGAIHRHGGPAILEECREIRRTRYQKGLPPGEAVMTTAGDLPSKRVIHTVGPVWYGGTEGEEETLEKAYRSSLELAERSKADTVAFPSISTGVYGFPKDLAGTIAFRTIRTHLNRFEFPKEIVLVFFSEEDYETFLRSIEPILGTR